MTPAFAGLLAFFSPCILPVLPFALCWFGARGLARGRGAAPFLSAVFAFSLGIALAFLQIGLGRSGFGQMLLSARPGLTALAALWLGVWGACYAFPSRPPRLLTGKTAAFASGLAFGMGLIPCIGPALSAILRLTAHSERALQLQGIAALIVYALAMALPFMPIALLWLGLLRKIAPSPRRAALLRGGFGLGVAAFALLLATDRIPLIAEWLVGLSDWSWVLL
ncbi:cytochrome c biogenesis protein CcdA [Paracoccus cavernae]|uniref:Cytochrome c biogenesis protein CcdA n=1 Tax=Paracoccus cavernae TaxID=1571207 RepID=A0ABT8D4G6_9RHOB|nr:cytochrome c biogenesis protein CcdA [Paracoccus cavernae]